MNLKNELQEKKAEILEEINLLKEQHERDTEQLEVLEDEYKNAVSRLSNDDNVNELEIKMDSLTKKIKRNEMKQKTLANVENNPVIQKVYIDYLEHCVGLLKESEKELKKLIEKTEKPYREFMRSLEDVKTSYNRNKQLRNSISVTNRNIVDNKERKDVRIVSEQASDIRRKFSVTEKDLFKNE